VGTGIVLCVDSEPEEDHVYVCVCVCVIRVSVCSPRLRVKTKTTMGFTSTAWLHPSTNNKNTHMYTPESKLKGDRVYIVFFAN